LGSEYKSTPNKGDRGSLKNLPFDEALDVSGSSVAKSEYDNGLDTSLGSLSDAKDTPKRGGGGGYGGGGQQYKSGGGGRANLGVVKDKPFDEAHSVGDESDDLSSEESVMTNDSEPKRPTMNQAQSKAPPGRSAQQGLYVTQRHPTPPLAT